MYSRKGVLSAPHWPHKTRALNRGATIVASGRHAAKPVLMVDCHDRGFRLLRNIAIDPHLSSNRRENELVSVIDRYPQPIGIGLL